MTDLTIKKIRDMLAAHNDGVYLLNARENIGEIVGFLLNEPEVTMNHLLAILDKATIAKGGVMTWEEGLRAIRSFCIIMPKKVA
jgi:hypothetical protein